MCAFGVQMGLVKMYDKKEKRTKLRVLLASIYSRTFVGMKGGNFTELVILCKAIDKHNDFRSV